MSSRGLFAILDALTVGIGKATKYEKYIVTTSQGVVDDERGISKAPRGLKVLSQLSS